MGIVNLERKNITLQNHQELITLEHINKSQCEKKEQMMAEKARFDKKAALVSEETRRILSLRPPTSNFRVVWWYSNYEFTLWVR